jgi:hypothetical protein
LIYFNLVGGPVRDLSGLKTPAAMTNCAAGKIIGTVKMPDV